MIPEGAANLDAGHVSRHVDPAAGRFDPVLYEARLPGDTHVTDPQTPMSSGRQP